MDFPQELQALQATDLQSLKLEVEKILRDHQQMIYQLRQFIEAGVKLNENCPDQPFLPLE